MSGIGLAQTAEAARRRKAGVGDHAGMSDPLVDPQEAGLVQGLNGGLVEIRGLAADRGVQGDEHRQLQHERQARRERIDPMLLVELHRLLLELAAVALVLLLQLLELGLDGLHGLRRGELLPGEREQHQPHDDREADDREAPRPVGTEPPRSQSTVDGDEDPVQQLDELLENGKVIHGRSGQCRRGPGRIAGGEAARGRSHRC